MQKIDIMEKLYVPKRIKAGYNERDDTYSGKLAYIIYWDVKGKLRKETSWRGWIEEELGEHDFDNVPTEGFVLNRAVGGVKRSWYARDARAEKVRVFDPRGFEIEIDMDNLLFILQENSSIVGKGLEGEFVYAWEGTQLVLLPTNCKEYTDAMNYTALQGKSVTKTDMVVGCPYKTKEGQNVIYLGRFDYTSSDWNDVVKTTKKHIFYNADFQEEPSGDWQTNEAAWEEYSNNEFSHEKFVIESGFTKLAVKVSEEPVGNLADLIDEYANTANASQPNHLEYEVVKLPEFPQIKVGQDYWDRERQIDRLTDGLFITRREGVWISVSFDEEWKNYDYDCKNLDNFKGYELEDSYFWVFDTTTKTLKKDWTSSNSKVYSREQLEELTYYKVFMVLDNGAKIPLTEYHNQLRGY